MSDNERILIRNAALFDAMNAITQEMNRILNRPIGEKAPTAVETLAKMHHEIFMLRK